MIKTIRFMCGFLAIAMVAFVASCSDDTNIGGGGSVPVGDGFYLAKVGAKPKSAAGLVSEKVEDDGFASQDREGFFSGFMFLEAGDYNVVNVIDQEIAQTIGGTASELTLDGSDCTLNTFTLIEEYAIDGAAVTIATSGLYKVTMDVDTKEILLYRIEKAHILGGATSFGFNQNDDGLLTLDGAATADGATFSLGSIDLINGDYKIRFNCRWTMNRRLTNDNFLFANGYQAFTNLGGTNDALVAGGSNIPLGFGNDGDYSVELNWTPDDGWQLSMTNNVPVAPKAVNSYAWGIVGSATPNGWPDSDAGNDPIGVDHALPLKAGSTATSATYEIPSVALTMDGEFKIRANSDWGIVLKPGIALLASENGAANDLNSTGGGDPNWKVGATGAGNYKVTVSTTNTGQTWTIVFTKL